MQDKCFSQHHKPGPRIIIQMTYLNNIGGIETACEHIARTFKDKNICFVVNALSDGVWAKRYHQIRAVYDVGGYRQPYALAWAKVAEWYQK